MPSRRISSNPNLSPIHEIAINPYSSFNSDNCNMLTRIVTGGKNNDFVVGGLDVTGVNTINSEVLNPVPIIDETFPLSSSSSSGSSGFDNWTGVNFEWDYTTQSVKAYIPSPDLSATATLTYNTALDFSLVGYYIKVQFSLTNVPKSLFIILGNETKSYDHPTAGNYVCYIQLSASGPEPLNVIFTVELDSQDSTSDTTAYLDNIILTQVINMGTDISPITLPKSETPDLYLGTSLDSTRIPVYSLHPHIECMVSPGVCIKDETTLTFTGTSNETPVLTLNYLDPNSWISGVPFGATDFPVSAVTYYTVNGGVPVTATPSFTAAGLLTITLFDDGSTPNVVKIVGNTSGSTTAYVNWAYLCVYYSYFKNPIPNNAYIGLVKESEISDARYGEDYLILAKLRFVDAQTVDAIVYYPGRKDLAYIDATKVTYNYLTQLKYWNNKPLNVSQALDELAYRVFSSSGSGGGAAGGGTGEFNVRWGTTSSNWVDPVTPSAQSIAEWATAYTINSASWIWSTITWNIDHWEAVASGTGAPGTSLTAAITQWTNPTQKAYVVFSTVPSHTTEFRLVNPTNPPGDNFVRGPLTSEVESGTSQKFLASDGTWQVPDVIVPSATDHSTVIFENYYEFQMWFTAQNSTYVWNTITKSGLNTTLDYGRLIFVTSDNSWWRTPRDPTEATLSGSWSSSPPTINNVPKIIQPVSSEFEIRWGTSTSSISTDWSTAYTANSTTWIWSDISWDTTTFKWTASAAVGSPVAPTTNWTAAAAAYPRRAYIVKNANDSTKFRIVNPYNPMGNGSVVGPTTDEVIESADTLYLSSDGTWKSVALQDAAANGDFYVDGLHGSTTSDIVLAPSSDSYSNQNDAPSVYLDGMRMRFIASITNTVNGDNVTTINVWNPVTASLLGSKILVKNGFGLSSIPILAGDIIVGQVYELTYSSTSDTVGIKSGSNSTSDILYANFINNSTIDLSSYNLNPANQSTYQIMLNNQIAGLVEEHFTVGDLMVSVSGGAIANQSQLFLGNGSGAVLWRQYCMNDNLATTAVVNTGITASSNGVSLYNTNTIQTTGSKFTNAPNYGFLFNSYLSNFIDLDVTDTLDDLSFQSTNEFSLSFWLNFSDSNSGMIYCRSNTNDAPHNFELYINSRLYLYLGGTQYSLTTNLTPFTSRVWNHVVVTFKAPNIKVYINGSLTNTISSSVYAYAGVGPTVRTSIGRHGARNSDYFNGRLSEFRIYNKEISSTNVNTIYTGGSYTTDLIRYFKLNDNIDDNIVIDSSSLVVPGHLYKTDYTTPNKVNSSKMVTALHKINGALYFDHNITNKIALNNAVGYASDLNSTSTFTYAFWLVDRGVNTGDWKTIISKGWTTGDPSAYYAWMIFIDQDESLGMYTMGSYSQLVSPSDMKNGIHIAIACNLKDVNVYINGTFYRNVTAGNICNYPGTLATGNNTIPYIGWNWHNNHWFDGILDDFRIYSKVLPLTDIQYIYNGGSGTEFALSATSSPATTLTNPTDYYSNTGALTTINSTATITITLPYAIMVDNIIFRNKAGSIAAPVTVGYCSNAWGVVSKLNGTTIQSLTLNTDGTTVQNVATLPLDGSLVDKLILTYTGGNGRLDNISILHFNRSNQLYTTLDGITLLPVLAPDGSNEYLDQIGTNQIINMQYNASSNSFIILNPKPELLVDTNTSVRGVYDGSVNTKLQYNTSTGTDSTAPLNNFVTNYDFFNTVTNISALVTYTNTIPGGSLPSLRNYWWRILPYKIPYGTKKIVIKTNAFYNSSFGYSFEVILTIDFINLSVTTEEIFIHNSNPRPEIYIDTISPGYNLITNTNAMSGTSYCSTLEFDDNFIYSLPITTNINIWINRITITTYK